MQFLDPFPGIGIALFVKQKVVAAVVPLHPRPVEPDRSQGHIVFPHQVDIFEYIIPGAFVPPLLWKKGPGRRIRGVAGILQVLGQYFLHGFAHPEMEGHVRRLKTDGRPPGIGIAEISCSAIGVVNEHSVPRSGHEKRHVTAFIRSAGLVKDIHRGSLHIHGFRIPEIPHPVIVFISGLGQCKGYLLDSCSHRLILDPDVLVLIDDDQQAGHHDVGFSGTQLRPKTTIPPVNGYRLFRGDLFLSHGEAEEIIGYKLNPLFPAGRNFQRQGGTGEFHVHDPVADVRPLVPDINLNGFNGLRRTHRYKQKKKDHQACSGPSHNISFRFEKLTECGS